MIKKTPGVCGGSACVGDHRITVYQIIRHGQLYKKIEYIIDDMGPYPQLTMEEILEALSYYLHNTEEIDQEIRENYCNVESCDHHCNSCKDPANPTIRGVKDALQMQS